MANYRRLTVALLTVLFLPMICRACSKSSPRPIEYEKKLCKYRTQIMTGFPNETISEQSLKNPSCSTAFSSVFETKTTVEDWSKVLDKKNRWASCPQGHFLQGFKFIKGGSGVSSLEGGWCVKFNKLSNVYDHCYLQHTKTSTNCSVDYFLTGIYRGDCSDWACISKLQCCTMTSSFTVDSVETGKEKVMMQSLNGLAQLASSLGYNGAKGCDGELPGDNFEKHGYSWVATKCAGDNSPKLKITFDDWSVSLNDIKYSQAKTTELLPQTIDRGVLVNDSPTTVTEKIIRNDKSIRTVTHSLTSSWKVSVGFEMEVTYEPPLFTGGVGGKFSFSINTETGKETHDGTENSLERSIQVEREKTMGPYSASEWVARMYRTRTTQYYKATFRFGCSVQFDGDLRKGERNGAVDINYHKDYTGQSASSVKYQFGDKDKPFYVAVKEERKHWLDPWLWGDLIERNPWVNNIVAYLASPEQYVIVLEGKFDDIQGYRVEIEFGNHTDLPRTELNGTYAVPIVSFRKEVHNKVIVAKEGPRDTPSGFTPVFNEERDANSFLEGATEIPTT